MGVLNQNRLTDSNMMTVSGFNNTLSITHCPSRQNKTNKQNTRKNTSELN